MEDDWGAPAAEAAVKLSRKARIRDTKSRIEAAWNGLAQH
jgi:hypothetical protein